MAKTENITQRIYWCSGLQNPDIAKPAISTFARHSSSFTRSDGGLFKFYGILKCIQGGLAPSCTVAIVKVQVPNASAIPCSAEVAMRRRRGN